MISEDTRTLDPASDWLIANIGTVRKGNQKLQGRGRSQKPLRNPNWNFHIVGVGVGFNPKKFLRGRGMDISWSYIFQGSGNKRSQITLLGHITLVSVSSASVHCSSSLDMSLPLILTISWSRNSFFTIPLE